MLKLRVLVCFCGVVLGSTIPDEVPPSNIYVCSSGIASLNGLYAVSDEHLSDELPVYIKVGDEDDDDDDDDAIATKWENVPDFRLFSYQGFWSFADFAEWPPTVQFTCSPHESHAELCARGQRIPPMAGYTPRDTSLSIASPHIQTYPCDTLSRPQSEEL